MKYLRLSLLGLGLMAQASLAQAQGKITTTKQAFGFTIGDDYRLANYTQFSAYIRKLDAESDRMTVQTIGKTAEGRDQLMAVITSPANQKLIAKYQGISQKLARAEGLTDDQARALAAEGKAVVWIDGGLHATEVLGAAQLTETIYQLVSRNDAETMNILNNVVILAVHANPDGMELVSNWYMKDTDEKKRNSGDIPRLYQKYIGHDNNRDFYMANQPETQNMLRQLFVEWNPQIMYNHHQTGPTGAVMFAPPFRDPFNYNFDPLIPVELDLVGAAMHSRFEAEGKPGVTMRKGANYSTWWNGGLRTSVYFHNSIGLLTETIGNPTPVEIEFVPSRMLPNADMPLPITPQTWHFRQSIEYSLTANWAVLDLAARMKDTFLFRMYQMGKNSIERGSKDHWTFTPHEVEALQAKVAKETRSAAGASAPGGFASSQGGRAPSVPVKYFDELKDPAKRDPRGFIISANQPDFPTATKFVNTLIHNGITIHRATKEFTVKGKTYPIGSFVVKTAQAFRPHVMDMFEPQDHPNDFVSPGGAPIPPYDNAGWTLAFQMGVQFDRILEAFDGPFEAIPAKTFAKPLPAQVSNAAGVAGFVLPAAENDSFLVVNRLLKVGVPVERMTSGASAGAFYVTANAAATPILQKAATDLGVPANGVTSKPAGDSKPMKAMRIGLADSYGGSMPSGWTRWLLEQFEFATVDQIFPHDVDGGNLNAKYDVLIFADEVLPESDAPTAGGGFFGRQPSDERAGEFKNRLGLYSVAKSVPQIKAFMEAGGKVVAVGSSTILGEQLGFVSNHLVERTAAGEKKLGREKYYVPGSILRAEINPNTPLTWGMPKDLDVFFDNSPVFELHPDAANKGVSAVAWFPNAEPLRSGWAWGQHYIAGGVTVAETAVGQGRLMMFGPEITFRGQPHGTFKFLFNGIYR
ncbi:MAG: M14 metallopeptidase family protein [Vicinamibacteria bacterium]